MSAELVMGIVAVVLAIVGGGAAWVRADQHGRTSADLERAEEDLTHAEKRAEVAQRAPAEKSEAARVLRGRLARAARRLRRVRAGRE